MSLKKNLECITGAKRGDMSKHRLTQYAFYSKRPKYYKSTETFKQVLEKLST